MTTKAKVIAGVVGGVLVVGGIGSAFNKDKDDSSDSSDISNSISQSILGTDSETKNSEDNSKVYTIDEFCTRFENEDDFAHEHKDQTFTISGTVDNKMSGTLYFESGFESEKWHTNYQITCRFEDKKLIEDITESANATISGKLFSFATSGIVLRDCTVVAFENPENSSSSDESSESSTSEQSSEPEQSNAAESEPQSTLQEPESSSEFSSVQSSVPESESTSTASETISSTPESSSALSVPSTDNSAHEVCIATSGNGKKYHRDPNCSKMNGNVRWLSISEAQALGYSACKKCA